jgi:two-component system nitrate/nitrite response regulator NarL
MDIRGAAASAATVPAVAAWRVLFCDRHRLFADSLAHVLNTLGHEVLFASSPEEAQQVVAKTAVDVCVMELDFGTDRLVSAITCLQRTTPPTPVVMLSAIDDPELLTPLLVAGAAGAVSKEGDLATVLETLTRVVAGGARRPSGGAPAPRAPLRSVSRQRFNGLTPREMEVLSRLVLGEGTAAVARGMGVSYATARTHIQHVLEKLGVHSRLAAVAAAVVEGERSEHSGRHADAGRRSSREESA